MKTIRILALGFWFALTALALPANAGPVAAIAMAITTSLPFVAAAVDTIIFYGIQTAIYAGLGYAANKLFGPKITDAGAYAQERQASVLTLQVGEVSRMAVFGEVALGGSLAFGFNYGGENGTDWVVKVVILADHRCDSLRGFYVGDTYQDFAGDGEVADYNGQLKVYWRDGAAGRTFPADLLEAWQTSPLHSDSAPSSVNCFTGLAYVVVAYKADAPDAEEPIWSGHPTFLWKVRGKRCYDPRKDTTVGGSGAHRWSDPSTWEWTRNPIVCRYNWVRGIYALDQVDQPGMLLVGRGLSTAEAPPQRVFAAANLCDELVDDGAEGTEPRYCIDGVVKATDPYITTEELFAAATAGQILQPEGGVEVEPGQAKTPVAEITDADLVVGQEVTFSDFGAGGRRVNTVIARYVEPADKWADKAAPIQREDAAVVEDGPEETTVPLSLVTRTTQAQRVARVRLKEKLLERRGSIPLPPDFAEIEAGDWIVWTSDRHTAGQPVTFRVVTDAQDQGWGVRLALEEVAFASYGFGGAPLPNTGGQTPVPKPAALALAGVSATAIQTEGDDGSAIPAIRFAWTAPVDPGVLRIRAEVRRAGHTETAVTVTDAVNSGGMDVTNGVIPNKALEARLVPLGGPGRAIQPTGWFSIYTGELVSSGVRLIGGRTPTQVLADLEGVAETARQLTQQALELSLRAIEERGQLLTETFHDGVRVKRILINEDQVWDEGAKSFWERMSLMAVLSEDGGSMILQQDTLMWSPTESLADHVEAIRTQIGTDIAAATSEIHTWVNTESAGATWIDTLEAAFGGDFLGSVTTMSSVVSGIGATWTLVLDVNGHISGIRAVNDGSTSSLVFLADEIAFTNGTGSVYPFSVVGGVVKATNFEADRVKAGSVVADSIVGGAVSNIYADEQWASGGGPLSFPNSTPETTIFSLSVTSDGGVHVLSIDVTCSHSGGGLAGVLLKLKRNGTQVGSDRGMFLQQSFVFSQGFNFLDIPGAGAHTYTITATPTAGSDNATSIQFSSLVSVELKK